MHDVRYSVRDAIMPLRLIFWGALICVLDLKVSQTHNGEGFQFDILNDAVGTAMVAYGVFRLGQFRFDPVYVRVMQFVMIVAAISILDAVQKHVIAPHPPILVFAACVFGIMKLIAILLFCTAMSWFCGEAYLPRAEQSWRTSWWLFLVVIVVPMGLLYFAGLMATFSTTNFNINLGPPGLLLLPIFCIPLVHLFVSTSRMQREAEAREL